MYQSIAKCLLGAKSLQKRTTGIGLESLVKIVELYSKR
jgi:hypothetical protein